MEDSLLVPIRIFSSNPPFFSEPDTRGYNNLQRMLVGAADGMTASNFPYIFSRDIISVASIPSC